MKGTSSKNQFMLWQTLAGSSLIGLVASFIQTVERIKFADDASAKLICDVNAKLSCSSVFDARQSSVFGFSNSIMCLAFFSILLGVALVGVTGSRVSRGLRLTMHAASLSFWASALGICGKARSSLVASASIVCSAMRRS